jgi:hypothetical protein
MAAVNYFAPWVLATTALPELSGSAPPMPANRTCSTSAHGGRLLEMSVPGNFTVGANALLVSARCGRSLWRGWSSAAAGRGA